MRARRSLTSADRSRLAAREVRRDGGPEEFEGRPEELARYLEHCRGRLAESVERLRAVPGRKLLELGADPFAMTQLLLEQGREVVTTNRPRGVWRPVEEPRRQQLTLRWDGRVHSLDHHVFDAERHTWPFHDSVFDVVVCAEVIEHLTYSPAHLLREANRVLAPGGTLFVSTPNSLAATKLARLLLGRTAQARYSGYGATGRHNREWTAAELALVLTEANFRPCVETVNLEGYARGGLLERGLRRLAYLPTGAGRRDHLFAHAVKAGPPRLSFPASLYSDIHLDRMREEGVELFELGTPRS